MKRCLILACLVFFLACATPAAADNSFIVRDTLGMNSLQNACQALSCTVVGGLDGSLGQLFLVTVPGNLDPNLVIVDLDSLPGVVDAEIDSVLKISSTKPPSGLSDQTPVNYFGSTVWDGYVNQPAAQIVRVGDAQSGFNATGSGIVGIIDTGIDPNHPAFANVIVSGYDFTRNTSGGSEMSDVSQQDNGGQPSPAQLTESTMAVVDPYRAQMLGNQQYSAFGHGTMVAGIIHLVAPQAQLMALKAFGPDGTGYLSDILRAVYYGVRNNVKVFNMSFDFPSSSKEMNNAVQYAVANNVICAGAAGNDGANVTVYPAGYTNYVMGIASTADNDTRSSFSNYGSEVWVAAPGEAIITTYPWGTYAAGWGTSFSTPFIAGGAALMVSLKSGVNQSQAANALGNAVYINWELGKGRIDLYQALKAFTSQ